MGGVRELPPRLSGTHIKMNPHSSFPLCSYAHVHPLQTKHPTQMKLDSCLSQTRTTRRSTNGILHPFSRTRCFRRAAYWLADSLLPATCITYRNLYLWGVFCSAEEGHQATQGGLKLAIWSRLTLNCSSSCLCLPGIGFTGVCHHAHLSVAFFEMPLPPSSFLSSL